MCFIWWNVNVTAEAFMGSITRTRTRVCWHSCQADESGDQSNEGSETLGQFVIAGGDEAEVFHATKQTFNEIAVLVLMHIVFTLDELSMTMPVDVRRSNEKKRCMEKTMINAWKRLIVAFAALPWGLLTVASRRT